MTGKRKCLSLREKIRIIEDHETSLMSTRKLAEKYGVGKTQVTLLLQNREELKKIYLEGGNLKQKRKFPKTGGFALDQTVFTWYTEARDNRLPISGPIIQTKALEVAQSLNIKDFKASNGWLDRFCRRHGISLKPKRGESAGVIEEDFNRPKVNVKTVKTKGPITDHTEKISNSNKEDQRDTSSVQMKIKTRCDEAVEVKTEVTFTDHAISNRCTPTTSLVFEDEERDMTSVPINLQASLENLNKQRVKLKIVKSEDTSDTNTLTPNSVSENKELDIIPSVPITLKRRPFEYSDAIEGNSNMRNIFPDTPTPNSASEGEEKDTTSVPMTLKTTLSESSEEIMADFNKLEVKLDTMKTEMTITDPEINSTDTPTPNSVSEDEEKNTISNPMTLKTTLGESSEEIVADFNRLKVKLETMKTEMTFPVPEINNSDIVNPSSVSEGEERDSTSVSTEIVNLSQVCARLRDIEHFFLKINKLNLAQDASVLLLKCETELFNSKLRTVQ